MNIRRASTLIVGLTAGLLTAGCGGGNAAPRSSGTGGVSGLNDFIAQGNDVSMWLQLAGTTGEATDAAHKGWIELGSFDWSVARDLAQSAKAGTADISLGVGEIKPIVVTKQVDSASNVLLAKSISGSSIGTATIAVRPAGRQSDSLRVLLDNTFVADWKQSIVSGNVVETVTLWFNKFKLGYRDVAASPVGAWAYSSWDLVKAKPWTDAPAFATRGLEDWLRP